MPDETNANYPVQIRTLGRFDVFIDGHPVTRWRAGKARNLLQYLLLRPGRVIPRDVLFEALWPALDAPRSSLKVAVHMLRTILADVGATNPGDGPGITIHTQESGYSIETTDVWIDFHEFGALIQQAHDHQTTTGETETTAKLHAATTLYHGDFLPGVTMPWAEPPREWLRSLALSTLHRLVATATQNNDDLHILNYCHKILDIDPLHEDTYRTLIRLHGQYGQLSQAHRWYKLCSTRLRDTIGMSPTETTRTVYRQALSGQLTRHRTVTTAMPFSS